MNIGDAVVLKNEARVIYGPNKPDDVVPAGTKGVILYLPEHDDPDSNWIGVTWAVGDRRLGVEVREDEVTLASPR